MDLSPGLPAPIPLKSKALSGEKTLDIRASGGYSEIVPPIAFLTFHASIQAFTFVYPTPDKIRQQFRI